MTDSVITVSRYEDARAAYRQKDLRQALYDEGEVIMGDVLVNLHGDEHRARRRLENRLFRRDVFVHYENDLFPAIIKQTLGPHVAAGRTDLVEFSHEMMMNLAALTAGVDRPRGTSDESLDLYRYLMKFIEGATLAHSKRDKSEVRTEVERALEEWDTEFLAPSVNRRREALAGLAGGTLGEDDLPKDVLTVLLRNEDDLHLPYDALRREIAFFLLAGAHTSATAFTRSIDHIFGWLERHPDDRARIRGDRPFVQRCVHETIRLNPSSPVGMRWATTAFTLRDGTAVDRGDKVVIDLMSVNRDPDVFGPTAADFDPRRPLPDGVAPYGLSFGYGMHACIGQDLAGGVVPAGPLDDGGPLDAEDAARAHLSGLVAVAVQALFDHGVTPDPDDPPRMDTTTARPYWGHYPVLFPAAVTGPAEAAAARLLATVETLDPAAVAACFTEDATYRNMPREPAVGRPAIEALFTPILGRSERVVWDVVSAAYEEHTAWLERIDRFWIEGRQYRIECNGVLLVDPPTGLIAEFRDYVDLGVWRARLADSP